LLFNKSFMVDDVHIQIKYGSSWYRYSCARMSFLHEDLHVKYKPVRNPVYRPCLD
jgi:hypothetical protein